MLWLAAFTWYVLEALINLTRHVVERAVLVTNRAGQLKHSMVLAQFTIEDYMMDRGFALPQYVRLMPRPSKSMRAFLIGAAGLLCLLMAACTGADPVDPNNSVHCQRIVYVTVTWDSTDRGYSHTDSTRTICPPQHILITSVTRP